MRVLITGAGGQVGRALTATAPANVEVNAYDRDGLDLTDFEHLRATIISDSPDVIINAAAFTAVDGAETEPELAMLVNGDAVGAIAQAAAEIGARLVQISTDFVFDGTADHPYRPGNRPNPVSSYGRSKMAGETATLSVDGGVVVRTSRVYATGGHNFVTMMLGLMGSRDSLRVVDDQVGSPTWATGLAETLWQIVLRDDMSGVWHWTDGGSCSWHEWATVIQEEALERGLLDRAIPIHPVPTSEYPTPAHRPAFSLLDCSGTVAALGRSQTPWRDALRTMLDEMTASKSAPTT